MERKRKREEKKKKTAGGSGSEGPEVPEEKYDYSQHVQMSLDWGLPGMNYQLFYDNLALPPSAANAKEGIMGKIDLG